MRRSRFSVEQIVAVLKQVELGLAVADACRRIGISEQTFYRWKKQYGSLEPDQARELRQLQEENGRLKRLVVNRPGFSRHLLTSGNDAPRTEPARGRTRSSRLGTLHFIKAIFDDRQGQFVEDGCRLKVRSYDRIRTLWDRS